MKILYLRLQMVWLCSEGRQAGILVVPARRINEMIRLPLQNELTVKPSSADYQMKIKIISPLLCTQLFL